MAKINSMMDVGKRSMMNSQTALQTVSHNIANKSTEGFSRQRVDLQTAVPITEGRIQIGMGNRAASVSRTNNPYLEKQLQKEQGNLGFQEGRAEGMSRVEHIFNEQANKGLNQYVTDFFNAFRELSNNPESVTSRTMVKEASEALVKDFKRVDDQLTDVQKDLDEAVKVQVDEANKMVREIGDLNEKIAQTEIQGIPANDQRDRRDLLLKKLNEKVDIKYAEGNNGMVTVSTAGNAILVSGYDSYEMSTYRDPDTDRLQVGYSPRNGAEPFNITARIKGGSIGGNISIRDSIIPDIRDKVDNMAYSLAYEVNKAHLEGFDKSGRPAELFFSQPAEPTGAARSLSLSEGVSNDVNKIAAGIRAGAAGDNTVANVISQLQYKQIVDGNSSTIDDYYNSQVGRVGVLAQRAQKAKESQANVVEQLNTIRDSISGVSLDEETTKMIEFQKGFEASARIIRTADEMFDTVLNLKRL